MDHNLDTEGLVPQPSPNALTQPQYGFGPLLAGLSVAHRARHAGFDVDSKAFTLLILDTKSTISNLNRLRLGLNPEEKDDDDDDDDECESSDKNLCMKWPALYRKTISDIELAVEALILSHGPILWDQGEYKKQRTFFESLSKTLEGHIKLARNVRIAMQRKGKENYVEYLTMLGWEMLDLQQLVQCILREVCEFSAKLIELAEEQGSGPACTLCTFRGTPLNTVLGSWQTVWDVSDVVVAVLDLCSDLSETARGYGIRVYDLTDLICRHFGRMDRLFDTYHPFARHMEDKLRSIPFFARAEEENLNLLRFLASELWREFIREKQEASRQGSFHQMFIYDIVPLEMNVYNGVAFGATLLGDLATEEYRSIRERYGIDPDEIGRFVWLGKDFR